MIDTKAKQKKRYGIRRRVMGYLTAFAVAVLALLWVMQIVLLDDFYRFNKTRQIHRNADIVAENIDNEELGTLIDHLASNGDMCIILADEHGKIIYASEDVRSCVIHRMPKIERAHWYTRAPHDGRVLTEMFSTAAPLDALDNLRSFRGRVPAISENRHTLLGVRRVTLADGTNACLLLNTVITPVDATVETLQYQLSFVTVTVLLGAMLLARLIARRLSRSIIETSEAARSLSRGEYTPPAHGSEYREMAELNATLSRAAHDLHQVERLQHELIANISHDLRTPLTMIGGYAEVMRDIPGESTPENMQVIIDETARLTTLVNEVMDFSRMEAGGLPMAPTAFDLTATVQEIAERISTLVEAKGYVIRFEPAQHHTALADEKRISQVVYNLIGNALTYTGEDKTVTITQTLTENRVRISIQDSGAGIPEDELPMIWHRYYRTKETHKRAVIGSGLGLSIVRSILEQHAVPYGVDSQKGVGSAFWFELPLHTSE